MDALFKPDIVSVKAKEEDEKPMPIVLPPSQRARPQSAAPRTNLTQNPPIATRARPSSAAPRTTKNN